MNFLRRRRKFSPQPRAISANGTKCFVAFLIVCIAGIPTQFSLATVTTEARTTETSRPIENRAAAAENAMAHIDSGVSAFVRGDLTKAVASFDAADSAFGAIMLTHPELHAMRAESFGKVGRAEDALREARLAYDFLNNGPTVPQQARDRLAQSPRPVDVDVVYGAILMVLKRHNDPRFEAALKTFMEITPTDAPAWSNRAAVLGSLGAHYEAINASARSVELMPKEPQILNNHCYILATADKAAESLKFCEAALVLAPQMGALRHSYSFALGKLGRCTEAQEQLNVAKRLNPTSVAASAPLVCTPRS